MDNYTVQTRLAPPHYKVKKIMHIPSGVPELERIERSKWTAKDLRYIR